MEENNTGDKKNIFSGDSGFSQEEKPKVGEKSFKAGFSNLGEGIGHIFKGFWHIFSKKFHMNVLTLLLIIALVSAAFYFVGFKPEQNTLNETKPGTTNVQIVFPPNVDTSLLEVGDIADIIAENCDAKGLENTLMDLSCPVAQCLECEQSPIECPECICETETVNAIHYQCLNGDFVEDKIDCW